MGAASSDGVVVAAFVKMPTTRLHRAHYDGRHSAGLEQMTELPSHCCQARLLPLTSQVGAALEALSAAVL